MFTSEIELMGFIGDQRKGIQKRVRMMLKNFARVTQTVEEEVKMEANARAMKVFFILCDYSIPV